MIVSVGTVDIEVPDERATEMTNVVDLDFVTRKIAIDVFAMPALEFAAVCAVVRMVADRSIVEFGDLGECVRMYRAASMLGVARIECAIVDRAFELAYCGDVKKRGRVEKT
jgi:hypothetical protein